MYHVASKFGVDSINHYGAMFPSKQLNNKGLGYSRLEGRSRQLTANLPCARGPGNPTTTYLFDLMLSVMVPCTIRLIYVRNTGRTWGLAAALSSAEPTLMRSME